MRTRIICFDNSRHGKNLIYGYKMREILLLACAFTICGCTSSIPVRPTGTPNEYVVVGRNMAAMFSSLELAQKESETKAMAYCKALGKSYVKKYAIDRPMAIGQAPESTLYFSCSTNDELATPQTTTTNGTSNSMKKLEELNAMFKKDLITQQEYNKKKQEILDDM